MKRTALIRTIEAMGCLLIRHGGNHDWYHNPATKASQPIPHSPAPRNQRYPGETHYQNAAMKSGLVLDFPI